MPKSDARRPVANRRIAHSALPAPTMYPANLIVNHWGRKVDGWCMRMEKFGPRNTPMTGTAGAFSIKYYGTSQIVTRRFFSGPM